MSKNDKSLLISIITIVVLFTTFAIQHERRFKKEFAPAKIISVHELHGWSGGHFTLVEFRDATERFKVWTILGKEGETVMVKRKVMVKPYRGSQTSFSIDSAYYRNR